MSAATEATEATVQSALSDQIAVNGQTVGANARPAPDATPERIVQPRVAPVVKAAMRHVNRDKDGVIDRSGRCRKTRPQALLL